MKQVTDKISLAELRKMAQAGFGDMVKAVVDVEKGIMVVDGELHADEEALLLQEGSKQEDLWGINLYPEFPADKWIEFDSMINLRPGAGNMSRSVESQGVRNKILEIVASWVER